jgi:hypothetical protein
MNIVKKQFNNKIRYINKSLLLIIQKTTIQNNNYDNVNINNNNRINNHVSIVRFL